MTEQLKEIGQRHSGLRQALDINEQDFAANVGISVEDLNAFEQGTRDFSFSFLHTSADVLGVDVIDLITGESPKLTSCSLVRNDQGLTIDRRAAYDYRHLAYTFRQKHADPFKVTVEPKDGEPVLHAHSGQEFNYMLSGKMMFYIGSISYELSVGDSVYFDSKTPHAMKALDDSPATFLAVVINEENGGV